MNLGENIYAHRTRLNMSQGDLADALDVSRQSVSKWENNNATPDLDKLIKMSALFGVTLDQLANPQSPNAIPIPPEISPQAPCFPTRKIVGILLLICGMLTFLVPTLLGGFLVGYFFGLPMTIIGCVLAFSEQEWCFRICWLLLAALYPLLSIFGINFVNFRILSRASLPLLALVLGLLVWTAVKFKRKQLSAASKKIIAASLALMILIIAFFAAFLLPQQAANPLISQEAEVEMILE